MSISKLQTDMKGLQEGLERIAVWWQLLERAINHLDVTTQELSDIPSDVAMVVHAIQNNREAIEANWEAFQQTLLRIITIRAVQPNATQYGLANALACAIIQATIDMAGPFDSTLLPETAESDEMSEMAHVCHQIANSKTNGEALAALSGYRKSIRARVIGQCNARLAEERAIRPPHPLDPILSEKARDSSPIADSQNNNADADGA